MTDVTIAALPVATSVADNDLIIVEEIGTPNVTKRATAAQMRAPLLPIAGGTVTGALTLNSTLTVVGATSTKSTSTMSAGGGWGGSNYGKQLLITTPAGSSNPAIGITDGNGVNLWGIANESGALQLASMPAYSDGVTAPTVVASLTATAVALNKNTKITGTLETTGALTVDAGGASVTGNSTITGTINPTAGVVAVTTNSSAAAGIVGEYTESSSGAVGLTTATPADLTSLSLTAGDWDVWGSTELLASTGMADAITWISTTSATLPTLPIAAGARLRFAATTFQEWCSPTGARRFSLSGTTTVYLSTQSTFATGTVSASGFILARRVR